METTVNNDVVTVRMTVIMWTVHVKMDVWPGINGKIHTVRRVWNVGNGRISLMLFRL